MALVAYDYDSGSEKEEDETSSTIVLHPNKKSLETSRKKQSISKDENKDTVENETNEEGNNSNIIEILSQLPKTKEPAKTNLNVADDKLEDFIPKYQPQQIPKEKKQQKVKITIPALSEFTEEDDDEPKHKRVKLPVKGSSLLAMLPPVKGSPLNTKSFIPNVLKNKPKTNTPTSKQNNNSLVPQAVRKKAEQTKKITLQKITKTTQGSDVESDAEDDIEIPETFDDDIWQQVCGRKIKLKPQVIETVEETLNTVPINIAPEPTKPYDGLDNAAFKELVGKSKPPVNIKLIDINEDEIVADKDLWLTKSLTDPDTVPKPAVENSVDPTRKKKHHITYLAEQAKANEQELQSQWSANKFARNQTRAKYGF